MQSAHEVDRAVYEIHVKGHLERRRQHTFGGMSITLHADGTTRLIGPVADQAVLHAMLRKIRDLGMPLVLVNNLSVNGQSDNEQGDLQ